LPLYVAAKPSQVEIAGRRDGHAPRVARRAVGASGEGLGAAVCFFVAPAAVPTPAVSHPSPALSNENLTSDTATGLSLPPPPATKSEQCVAGERSRQISPRTGMACDAAAVVGEASRSIPVFRCQSTVVTLAVCT
jgi:hypothetical protein